MKRIIRDLFLLFLVVAPVALVLPPAALFPFKKNKIAFILALLVFAVALVLLFTDSKMKALAVWLPLSLLVWLFKAVIMFRSRPKQAETPEN